MIGLAQRFDLKVRGAAGEAKLSEEVYRPVIDLLADHTVKTIGELEAALCPAVISWSLN